MESRTLFCATLVAVIAVLSEANAESGPTAGQVAFLEKILTVADVIERSPELKAEYESEIKVEQFRGASKVKFTCDVSFGRSQTRPTSVHKVRPGDIDVIAAFGDSISAGNGIGAITLPGVALQNRGEVWSIGGDDSIEKGVITLPNILRKFNDKLIGYSVGTATRSNLKKSALNVAEPGAISSDLPGQARLLVERIKADSRYQWVESWKLVTMFIGGNDLCEVCNEPGHSSTDYYNNYLEAVTILRDNLVRTIVNLVPMFDVTPLETIGNRLLCSPIQGYFCSCARNANTKPTLRPIQMEYYEGLQSIASDARFKRDDFAVVIQPHMRDMVPPKDPVTGKDVKFVGPDCFHPNRDSHRLFASWMWNSMLTPVGKKPFSYDPTNQQPALSCPTQEHPYLFTDGNSA